LLWDSRSQNVSNRERDMYLEGKKYWCGWDGARRRRCRAVPGAIANVGRVIANCHMGPPLVFMEMEEDIRAWADLPSPMIIAVIIRKPTP